MVIIIKVSGHVKRNLRKIKSNEVSKSLDKFVDWKKQTPYEPYGGNSKKDYPFAHGSIKGNQHAHLPGMSDMIIVYDVVKEGANIIIELLDLGTHNDFGIGNPPNKNKQDQLAQRITGAKAELGESIPRPYKEVMESLRLEGEQADMFKDDFANKDSTTSREITVSSKGAKETIILGNINSRGGRIANSKQSLDKFHDWFGDSEAVDKEGRPLVFFHGTRTDVSKFKAGVPTKNTGLFWFDYDAVRHAVFFTLNPEFASSFAEISGSGSNVMPVYLQMLDPCDLTKGLSEEAEQRLDRAGYNIKLFGSVQYTWELFDAEFHGDHFAECLKKAGYDSVIFNEEDDAGKTIPTFAVFNSNQVKSAIGNIGSFSNDSDEITEAYTFHNMLKSASDIGWIDGIPVMSDASCSQIQLQFPNIRFKALTESGLHECNTFPKLGWYEFSKNTPPLTPYYNLINENVISELFDVVEVSYGSNAPLYNDRKVGGKVVAGHITLATLSIIDGLLIGITFRQTNKDVGEWSVDFRIISEDDSDMSYDRKQNMVNAIKSMSSFYSKIAYIVKDVSDDHQEFRYIKFTAAPLTPQEDKLSSVYSKFIESKSFQSMVTRLGWKHVKDNRYIRANITEAKSYKEVMESLEFQAKKKMFIEKITGNTNGKETLYVHRPLLNPEDLIKWAHSQGFEKTLSPDDFHCTIVYSKAALDTTKFEPKKTKLQVSATGRDIDKFGDAIVLLLKSDKLQARWKEFMDGGASWDHASYQPHVTITYDGGDIDCTKIEPYTGDLIFGPEEFEELDEDWADSIDEVVKECYIDGEIVYITDSSMDVIYQHCSNNVVITESGHRPIFHSHQQINGGNAPHIVQLNDSLNPIETSYGTNASTNNMMIDAGDNLICTRMEFDGKGVDLSAHLVDSQYGRWELMYSFTSGPLDRSKMDSYKGRVIANIMGFYNRLIYVFGKMVNDNENIRQIEFKEPESDDIVFSRYAGDKAKEEVTTHRKSLKQLYSKFASSNEFSHMVSKMGWKQFNNGVNRYKRVSK